MSWIYKRKSNLLNITDIKIENIFYTVGCETSLYDKNNIVKECNNSSQTIAITVLKQ